MLLGCQATPITALEIRGVLIDVQSREIVHADAVTGRDDQGKTTRFQVSDEVASNQEHPNTAAHLRQHMMAGDPVVVVYRMTSAGPLALRIRDR